MHFGFEFLAGTSRLRNVELIDRCLAPLLAALQAHPGVVCAAAIDDSAHALIRADAPASAAVLERLQARGQLRRLFVAGSSSRPESTLPVNVAWVPEGAWPHLSATDLKTRRIETLRLHPSYGLCAEEGDAAIPLRRGRVRVGNEDFLALAGERRRAPWLLRLEPLAAVQRGPMGVVPLSQFGLEGDSHDLLHAAGWLDDFLALLPAQATQDLAHGDMFAGDWMRARVLRIEQLGAFQPGHAPPMDLRSC